MYNQGSGCAQDRCPTVRADVVMPPDPTAAPTKAPSESPTIAPTLTPTPPTPAPTPRLPQGHTYAPTSTPTSTPTQAPTREPRQVVKFSPPPLDGEKEVPIEGLAVADFPPDLSEWFWFQNVSFIALYTLLALRIALQFVITDGVKTCCTLNRHHIATSVLLGCIIRVVYIVMTDVFSSLHPNAAYVLRAVNEVFWFAAFAFLAFFWYELQNMPLKHIKVVSSYRPHLYGTIGVFATMRAGRVYAEIAQIQVGVLCTKGAVGAFLIGFFLFCEYWGKKLLAQLKSMAAKGSGKQDPSKNAAINKFTAFLVVEGFASLVCLFEAILSITLARTGVVSLTKTPHLVFFMKVVARSMEFLMMSVLVFLVCLKTASNNLKTNKIPRMVPKIRKRSKEEMEMAEKVRMGNKEPSKKRLAEAEAEAEEEAKVKGDSRGAHNLFGLCGCAHFDWGDSVTPESSFSEDTFTTFDGRDKSKRNLGDSSRMVYEMGSNPLFPKNVAEEMTSNPMRCKSDGSSAESNEAAIKMAVQQKREVKKEDYTEEVKHNTHVERLKAEKTKKTFGPRLSRSAFGKETKFVSNKGTGPQQRGSGVWANKGSVNNPPGPPPAVAKGGRVGRALTRIMSSLGGSQKGGGEWSELEGEWKKKEETAIITIDRDIQEAKEENLWAAL
jgi:hypothetical protein